MTERAMLFPGQGAQFPGMGKEFAEAYPEADALFDRAVEVLDFDLKSLCFKGPEDELNRTDICQPGILTTSLAILEVLKKRHGLVPGLFQATAGLSLGEYTALVFAGVLTFEDALSLVAKRGRFMQEDSNRHPSGMMSLLNAAPEQVEEIVRRGSEAGVLVAANYLAPQQVAISGSTGALDLAESILRDVGIRKGVRLKVAGAFHSPLMAEGGKRLKDALEKTPFKTPAIPFASNVTGRTVRDPEEIRENLGRQVTCPVLWSDTITHFIKQGITSFYEPGPGKVLAGLVKKVDRSLETHNLNEVGEITSFVSGWQAPVSGEEVV